MTVVAFNKSPLINAETGSFGEDIGTDALGIRLATSPEDIEACQHLRSRVFYEEMGATPCEEMAAKKLDFDKFDETCDHIMVINKAEKDFRKSVVGTYRLNRSSVARENGGFYSSGEYDISKIVKQEGELLELGRSAVDENFRTRPTMQLMWRGIAAYLTHHKISMMFGCVSLPGIDPEHWKVVLSYLYHHHLAPPAFRARALDGVHVDMNMMPESAVDPKQALQLMPPLFKGYLRVGCFVGDGAFVDHQWNSVDVFFLIKTENITDRYMDKYLSPYESGS